MPFVNIRITKEGHVGKKEKAQLIHGVTKLLADTLGKNPASTVVIIDEVDTDNYGLGGSSITTVRKRARKEQKLAAKAEKARLRAEREAQAAALVPAEKAAPARQQKHRQPKNSQNYPPDRQNREGCQSGACATKKLLNPCRLQPQNQRKYRLRPNVAVVPART